MMYGMVCMVQPVVGKDLILIIQKFASIYYIDEKLYDPYEMFHTFDSDPVGNFLCSTYIEEKNTTLVCYTFIYHGWQAFVAFDAHRGHRRQPAHTYSVHTHPKIHLISCCHTRVKLLMFFVGENSRFAELLAAMGELSILSSGLPGEGDQTSVRSTRPITGRLTKFHSLDQCCGSGSVGYISFWASRIRIY